MEVFTAQVPAQSYVVDRSVDPYYSDSFEFMSDKDLTIVDVYIGIFGVIPAWIMTLMKIRNALGKVFGLSVESEIKMSPEKESFAVGSKAGFLEIEHVSNDEVVASAKDSDIDLWISVMQVEERTYRVSTLVNMCNRKGVIYMKVIKPFHKLVARKAIEHALKTKRI